MSGHTAYRVCPICEANCGLEVTVEEERVIAIRGNENDKISLGHVCPKGVALMELRDDPDRVRTPMIRKEGKLVEASWEEAFAVIKEKFADIKSKYGSEALALYIGNATIGTTPFMVGYQMLLQCMETQNLYTAGSMDHLPKLLTCKEMYGWEYTNPVPDIDNSDYILMIGANPMVSNGSLWLATGFRKRLKAMQARGGELEVIDPRFTETAKVADNHNFIKPGQDPYFLLGLLHVIYRDDLINPGIAASHVNGLAEIQQLAATIDLAQMSENCGIEVRLGDANGQKSFIRKSELSRDRNEQRPERFAVGDKIDARITAIDSKSRRISLSVKAREIAEENEAVEQYGSADSGASLGDILGAALKDGE